MAQQNSWQVPTSNVPQSYVSSAQALFKHGLSDPRGCKYCKVRLLTRAATAGTGSSEVYGWVLPAPEGAAHRVVLWDGVEYPSCEVLEDADLQTSLKHDALSPNNSWQSCWSPGQSSAAPALLLLLNLVAEAEAAYESAKRWQSLSPAYQLRSDLAMRYKMLAADALKIGRFEEGAAWADQLNEVLKVKLPLDARDKRLLEYQDDDWQAEELLHDLRRRLKDGHQGEPDVSTLAGLSVEDQISVLVRSLDQVRVEQSGQPGGLEVSWSSIVHALTKIGPRAVPALIDCIESDTRLTRSVSFWRDFAPMRHVLPVREAAAAALVQIWPSAAYRFTNDPKLTVANLRRDWNAVKSKTEPERQLADLEDDLAGPRTWIACARYLVQSVDIRQLGKWTASTEHPRATMNGEELKDRRRVTQALLKRAMEIEPSESRENYLPASEVASLAICLFKWEKTTAVPALIRATILVQQAFHNETKTSPVFGALISARLSSGDKDALAIFENSLGTVNISSDLSADDLRPFFDNSDSPGVKRLTERFFGEHKQDWTTPKDGVLHDALFWARFQLRGPLMSVPAFRDWLVAGLNTKKPFGEAWLEKFGASWKICYKGKDGGSGSYGMRARPVDTPPENEHVPISIADLLAQDLSGLKGAPKYMMVWPAERRDQARTALVDWLKNDKFH